MTTSTAPINSRPGDEVMLDVPTDILASYHYFAKIDVGRVHSWGTRIIGDSGAFSALSLGAPIDREEFHAWAHRWRDDLFWCAALDVIGDPDGTFVNWQAARDDGLDLVPTLHYGEPASAMDRYVEAGVDFLGLGGMVPYGSEPERLMRWCLSMHRHAAKHHPHVRFHGWGVSHPLLLDNLPWWSTDSSGFASAFRFGRLRLFEPRRGRYVGVDLNGREIAPYRPLLRREYGITDWKTVATSTPETRRAVGRLAIRSMQLYAKWLQRRQRVAPPASLVPALDRVVGPLQPGAIGNPTAETVMAINPDDGFAPKVGPLQSAALGAPSMQPVRGINPEDGYAPAADGPVPPRGPLVTTANVDAEFVNPPDQPTNPKIGES